MHILKKFAPRPGKKGSRPGGSPNSLVNNEHSGKALYFLSFSFMFVLSFSFIFFHFLSLSFFSVIFFHCFSFFFSSCPSFFGVLKILFFPRLPHDFLLKLLCKKQLCGPSRAYPPIGPFFFLSILIFLFFFFVFFFQFLSMFFRLFLFSLIFHSLFL